MFKFPLLFLHKLLPVFLLLSLGSCIDPQLANGVGGTGISAGRLTAFGSIYVNGIKFDTDSAIFNRNGQTGNTQNDFLPGEIITVQGTFDRSNRTGVAKIVSYQSTLTGPLSYIDTPNSFVVQGITVYLQSTTVLQNFQTIRDLSKNDVIDISGFPAAKDKVIATSIRRLSGNEPFELRGIVTSVDSNGKTFDLDSEYTIDYSALPYEVEIKIGSVYSIEVLSPLLPGKIIALNLEAIESTDLELKTNSSATAPIILTEGMQYEIEGIIITNTDSDTVMLYGIPVVLDDNQIAATTTDLGVLDFENIAISRITGTVDEDERLSEPEIQYINAKPTIVLTATIDKLDITDRSLEIMGRTLFINPYTIFTDNSYNRIDAPGFENLSIGDNVTIDILEHDTDNTPEVLRVNKVNPVSLFKLESVLRGKNIDSATLDLFGITVQTTSNSRYLDNNEENILSHDEFFQKSIIGHSIIKVTGTWQDTHNNVLLADTLIIR